MNFITTRESPVFLGDEQVRYELQIPRTSRKDIANESAAALSRLKNPFLINSMELSASDTKNFMSLFNKIKGGITAQKAYNQILLEKGVSADAGETDSYEEIKGSVNISNLDNPQDKAILSPTNDTILILFRNKKTGEKGVLRIYRHSYYEVFKYEPPVTASVPVPPAPVQVAPSIQPTTIQAASVPASSKKISPFLYVGVGIIAIIIITKIIK